MDYVVDNMKFGISYSELKEHYTRFIEMSDKEFLKNIPEAIHLACIICFFKEIPTYICLSDTGIIHELSHILHIGVEEAVGDLKSIRKSFKKTLKLC